MKNGIVKAHHGIMTMTAKQDYEVVKSLCQQLCLHPVEPKGKSWQKIEDATSAMVKLIPNEVEPLKLNRGVSYYKSL